MGWVKHSVDSNMPEWLSSKLSMYCECGAEKENYYNDKNKCTSRRCPNRECPWTLAQKISAMCDILQVSGIAEGRGLQLAKEYKLHNHYEAIPIILKDKPLVTLAQLLKINFMQGVDTKWEPVCAAYSSVDELVSEYKGELLSLIKANLPEIKESEKYFNIVKVQKAELDALITGTVTLSGTFRGYKDRDNFIKGINTFSKGLVRLSICDHKRKTGIMCHIQEEDASMKGKGESAIDNGISIMTPDEFQAYIVRTLNERMCN